MTTTTPDTRKQTSDDASSSRVYKLGAVGGDWLDQRLSGGGFVKFMARKIFPDHWSFMFGEVALYSFVILLISGTFLTMFFDPSMEEVVYSGPYTALQGEQMSRAFESTLHISFEVKGGLLFRQMHHWSALVFMVAIFVHMFRVFFTGAFRKPRELNWLVGFTLMVLGMVAGFSGYSLPDDVLSGNGLRVIDGLMKAIPIIGTYLSMLLFNGEFPGTDIIPRLFTIHILLVPAMILGLIAIHLVLLVLHKHTQYPGPGRTERNVVGFPVFPVYAAKAGGFFFLVFGIITLISATTAINGVWVYGPYDPSPVSAGSQPDWYMLWTDGGLRLMPGWEFTIFGYVVSLNMLIPFVVYGALLGFMAVYPFLEAWVTGDDREHHLNDLPYNAPVRMGLGIAWISIYLILALAATNDIIAIALHMSINDLTWAFRIGIFVAPVLLFFITKRLCLSFQRHAREKALHGTETSRVVRTDAGQMLEIHEPLNEFDRWVLVQHDDYRPLRAGKGVSSLRAKATSFFFKDRIEPVTPAELRAALEHAGHEKHKIDAVTGGDYRTPAEKAHPEG
ncbi:cytochrome bc1 complex cytochrome b subunit [Brachybacterium alimentarium]|uniref:cytochrome bc1 complex cytochrome b subunit n=1 Tax=Brachybacterium alimentarium TaxID=47845 RepID=UPI000DF3AED6|nr:cytochrome bc complex cytochrome b subunit [Brachybacterium alimentarium]RCS68239.1 cytochrome bc complex cytochrome b subunit [Brachybacterium alimentarium]RCS69827.1 cytochrome bc complex cytochrome b subunit [Brachybacterium alimentarium]RCS77888.1 cytochrome bc complex cytochrome b subunit [Brachybacterium alimentarium]RCS78587.1 cytochrome bc complex cytochrome b subunit [Brachybacterium alimentarium]RCS83839.1 cytochrome bc complex cytochrome b subunit [Brachybacterium alimentarium]